MLAATEQDDVAEGTTRQRQRRGWPNLRERGVFLGWMLPFYRFCRLVTSKVGQPIPSRHFTMLTQNWSIDFLKVNKIGRSA